LKTIVRYPLLKEFHLSLGQIPVSLPLHTLPALRKVSLCSHSDYSIYLALKVDATGAFPITLYHIFGNIPSGACLPLTHLELSNVCLLPISDGAMTHFGNLVSLKLTDVVTNLFDHGFEDLGLVDTNGRSRYRSAAAPIFRMLSHEEIRPRRLVLNDICNTVMDFLSSSSYRGFLEELVLHPLSALSSRSPMCSALAKRFYTAVLPFHIESIQVLDIRPKSASEWCFRDHFHPVLLQCKKLKYLSVVLHSSVSFESIGNLVRSLWNDVRLGAHKDTFM